MNRSRKQRCTGRRRLLTEQLEDRRLLAGPYAPAAGEIGSTAVAKDDTVIEAWATAVTNYSPGSDVDTEFQTPNQAIGPAQGTSGNVVSLGRGGEITLSFDAPIRDGIGPDFVVFENSINDTFLELGFVEVSSDGTNFFRFENDSLTPSPVDAFSEVDPTNVHNLAGKYRQGFGTPFDLEDLSGVSPLLNIANVTHVRLVDIVGDGSQTDTSGDVIYDPYPTIGSAGLDIDAVGVIHQAEFARDFVTFEDVGAALPVASAFRGPDPSGSPITGPFGGSVVVGSFQSETLKFNNAYSTDFESWNGWAYSNATNTTTPGYTNQFSAYVGGGADGSATYGIGFPDQGTFFDPPTISRDVGDRRRFDSLMVTNTTYAALSIRDGDSFAKKFGGSDGNDADFLLLTITGKNSGGDAIGTVEFYLADYRFTDNSLDYIIDQWIQVDLSPIAQARSLEFAVNSSDVGPFGINTPAFFAVDEITLVKPILQIDIADREVIESDGEDATLVRISRSDNDTSAAIDVSITPVDAQIAVLPTSVTIPVGSQFVEFPIDVVDNDLFEADRSITVEASADGFVTSRRTLTIHDDDARSLTLSLDQTSVDEGSSRTATVSRNDADLSVPLSVQIDSTESSLLSFNETVTIAAGQASANFTVLATDDQVDRPSTQVSVSASAADYIDASVSLDLIDNDQPSISIEVDPSAFAESAAPPSGRLEDVGRRLPPESFYDGADLAGGFSSGGLAFNNDFDPIFGSWSGWSFSNTTDTATPGYTNQYSALPGIGASESDAYAVASAYTVPTITRDPSTSDGFQSLAITNTTYAALSMMHGDAFAKKFGGQTGDEPDFFLLTIEGVDSSDSSIGSIEFFLADFRFTDNSKDYIVDDWTTVDLSSISAAVQLKFSLTSSDVGSFGMNTPAYFAADNVALVSQTPQPMVTIRRNTLDVSQQLQVTLTSNDPTEALLPATAMIPAGASSALVPLTIVDDDLVDGDQNVTLAISAASHVASNASVTITDDETASLSLSIPTAVITESNGEGRAVVHRNVADTALPLEIELSVDADNQLTLPGSVIIPAGKRSVEFTLTAKDNSIVDEDRTVMIRAAAEGFSSAQETVSIINDDVPPPTLSLELDRTMLSESDAPLMTSLEDIGATLPGESFDNGADLAAGFDSGSVRFNNTFDPTFGSWGGWSVSNSTDHTTPGFGNQYSAITGGGANHSATYAVASAFPGGTIPTISLESGLGFESLMVTNSTYAALSMSQGDAFAKKFGGQSGDDPDFFLLTIEGRDADDHSVGFLEFYLADFRFEDNGQDYIVDQWTAVDVSSLVAATRLEFSLSSSDVGDFGMNTPAYFAIDNVVRSGDIPAVAIGTVTRSDTNLEDPLVVSLRSDDLTEATLASSVTIESGASSATFEIRAVDDAVVDGDRVVQLTVAAETHQGDLAELIVEDDDVATLTLSFSRDTVVESEGSSATTLLVHRNTQDLASPLPVAVSFEGSDLQLPEVITIPVGAAAHVLKIGISDNMILDGDRVVSIQAAADGFTNANAAVNVQDDEVAGLWLTESGDDTIVDELLGQDSFSVSLSAQPQSDVFVDLSFVADDVTLDVVRLVFMPQQWDQPQIVTARGVPDLVAEVDEIVVVNLRVDADASDSSFAAAQDATLNLIVQDYQPNMLRLGEDDEGIFLTDEDSGLRIFSAAHRDGIEVVTNQLDQRIVFDPLALTRGPVRVDASAGDDTVIVHGIQFTSLDGGEGHDQLVLKLNQAIEFVDFLDGRVVGFEEIVISSDTAAELVIDTRLLESVVSDDGTLLIQVDADQNLTFLGQATIEAPIMVGDSFAQVVRYGEVSLHVISPAPWQNVLSKWDVNRSGNVTSLDALAVVNQIARVTNSVLPVITSIEEFTGMYFDVSGDGQITSLDALRVINELSRREFANEAEMILSGKLFETPEDRSADRYDAVIETLITQPAEKLVVVSSPHEEAIRQLYAGEAEVAESNVEQTDAESRVLQTIS